MFAYVSLFFFVGAAIGSNIERENPHSRVLQIDIKRSQNLLVHEENTILKELRDIYLNNNGNIIRASKLAEYLYENNFCDAQNGWNIIIIDDAWYDRQTFIITSQTVKFLALKTHGLGYREEIYVIFNECEVKDTTTSTSGTIPTTSTAGVTTTTTRTTTTEAPIPTMIKI